jgi:hypothetical protein
MIIFQGIFTITSILLIPFAWIIGTFDKIKAIKPTDTPKDIAMNLGVFALLGPVVLTLDIFADSYYFWIMMFRSKLKQIIIEREKSTVDHRSIRTLMSLSKTF